MEDTEALLTPLGIAVIPILFSMPQNVGNSDFDRMTAFANDINGTVEAVMSVIVPTLILAAVLYFFR